MISNISNKEETITAIDENGVLFPIEKMKAHLDNTPHLAISVFVFHRGKLLLQQRALHKYHSGGLWANTCCSHPRWRETPEACAERRVQEELGFTAQVSYFGKIDYAADVGCDSSGSELFENEQAYCFVGEIPDDTCIGNFNKEEVKAVRWIDLEQLRSEISLNPSRFTQWIKIYVGKHFELLHNATKELTISGCLT